MTNLPKPFVVVKTLRSKVVVRGHGDEPATATNLPRRDWNGTAMFV